jgi:hypothetical protein
MKRPLFTNIEGTCNIQGSKSGGDYRSTLERDGVFDLLLDPEVADVQYQKPRIFYLNSDGKKRRYTADLLVTFHAGLNRRPLAIEFKYEEERKQKPELKDYFDVIEAELDRLAFDFEIRTEEQVYSAEFSQKEFYWGYHNDEASPLEGDILNVIRHHRTITAGALIDSLRLDKWVQLTLIPVVWRLVAHKRIFVDFNQIPDRRTVLYSTPLIRGTAT